MPKRQLQINALCTGIANRIDKKGKILYKTNSIILEF